MKKNMIYYLGPKQSNIEYSNFFDGSITLFGDSKNNNTSYEKEFCFEYWNENNMFKRIDIYNKLLSGIKEECNIMLHDQYLDGLCTFGSNLKPICTNDISILEMLNDKVEVHKLMGNIVPMLDYSYIPINNVDVDIFKDDKKFVFQKKTSSGGALTYIVNKSNFGIFKKFNNDNEKYLISEYKDNNIPLNVHCIIFNDYIEILKPSIQILELNGKIEYIDSDYKTILDRDVKNKIYEYSHIICKKLKEFNYLGVLGIDFIYTNDELFFIEINPRFQGSTKYLDKILQENNFKSVYEYNYNAFYDIENKQINKYFYE